MDPKLTILFMLIGTIISLSHLAMKIWPRQNAVGVM
jgi:hypothetical protein